VLLPADSCHVAGLSSGFRTTSAALQMHYEIGAAVRRFIAENFLFREDIESLPEDASFLEAGIIDSTGVLELVCFLETTYGIQIAGLREAQDRPEGPARGRVAGNNRGENRGFPSGQRAALARQDRHHRR
jgi:acyl carrier protein